MAMPARIETSLRRIVVGYRLIAAIWLAVLILIAVARNEPDRPSIAIGTLVVVAGWTLGTVWLSYRYPNVLRTVGYLVVDGLLSVALLVTPDLAGSVDFYGGYPVSSIFLAIYATGLPGAVVMTSALAGTAIWRAVGPRNTAEVFGLITSIVVYPFIAAPAAWAVGVLRRSDRLRREAELALDAERAERIRAEERAGMAAHLHDSVLQSLALIQRDPSDRDQVVTIARRQERELRQWLFDPDVTAMTVADAIDDLVTSVEEQAHVRVNAVVVGDAPLDAALETLIAAGREAVMNAAKHAQVDEVALYLEVSDDNAELFIRDRGLGFEPGRVPADRRGLSESIIGRMERIGGTATVTSEVGDGTEIALTLDRRKGR